MNNECIRDILIYLERMDFYDFVDTSSIIIKSFSHDDIAYHAEKLIEANFLNAYEVGTSSRRGYIIKSITYSDHLFFDNIRPVDVYSNWKI